MKVYKVSSWILMTALRLDKHWSLCKLQSGMLKLVPNLKIEKMSWSFILTEEDKCVQYLSKLWILMFTYFKPGRFSEMAQSQRFSTCYLVVNYGRVVILQKSCTSTTRRIFSWRYFVIWPCLFMIWTGGRWPYIGVKTRLHTKNAVPEVSFKFVGGVGRWF